MSRRVFYLDLLERTLWTLAQGAVAFWIENATTGEVTWRSALIAGGLAAAKAFLARSVGDHNSAATLPSPPDHTLPVPDDDYPVI